MSDFDQHVLKTAPTEDWHLATALVTCDAAFAALSVKYGDARDSCDT